MKRNLAAPNKGRSPVYQSSALRCRREGEEKVIKAVILDFYGTIVEESYALLDRIAEVFVAHGAVLGREKIAALWWPHFREQCDAAYGDSFCLQRDIYPKVFECMARETGAEGIDFEALRKEIISFAVTSPMLEDAEKFLEECPLPYYILSNIDNAELRQIISLHGLRPRGIFTSEDAMEYKPRKGIFEKGLKKFGLSANEAVYAGDSYINDYCGASEAGILSFWLNRKKEPVPKGVRALPDLHALLPTLERIKNLEKMNGNDAR